MAHGDTHTFIHTERYDCFGKQYTDYGKSDHMLEIPASLGLTPAQAIEAARLYVDAIAQPGKFIEGNTSQQLGGWRTADLYQPDTSERYTPSDCPAGSAASAYTSSGGYSPFDDPANYDHEGNYIAPY